MPIKFNVKTRIVVNGKEYSSPEEMPEEVRRVYERARLQQEQQPNLTVSHHEKISIDGQTFNTVEEMPPDIRRIYDSVMASIDKNQDGVPDSLQSSEITPTRTPNLVPSHQDSVIAPAGVDKRLVVAGLAVLLLVLILAGLLIIQAGRGF